MATLTNSLHSISQKTSGVAVTEKSLPRFARSVQMDLSSLAAQWNGVALPLFKGLLETPQIKPLEIGLSGNVLYTHALANAGDSDVYFDTVSNRRRSIKESFDVLIGRLGEPIPPYEGGVGDEYDDTDVRNMIATNETNLLQLRQDSMGPNYTWTGDGSPDLNYPLSQHLDAIGAFFSNYPTTGNSYSTAYPALALAVNLSDINIDTTLPQSTITGLTADLSYIRQFMGKTLEGPEMPTYSDHVLSLNVVSDGNSLEMAIAKLDEAIGSGGGGTSAHAHTHIRGGSDEIDGDRLDISYVPTNYTRSTAPPQVTNVNHLTAHLAGINAALSSIGVTPHATTHLSGGTDELDGDRIDIDYTPTNYTPDTAPSQVSLAAHLTAHLAGINTVLGTIGNVSAHAATHINGGTDVIDADKLKLSFIPANYVRRTEGPHSTLIDDLTSHLAGIDDVIGGGGGGGPHAATHISGAGDEIDGDQLDIDYTPTNYTPSTAPSEVSATAHLTAHLAGIDAALTASGGLHASTHIRGGADEIDGDELQVDYVPGASLGGPAGYTRIPVGGAEDKLVSNLYGIDERLSRSPFTSHSGQSLIYLFDPSFFDYSMIIGNHGSGSLDSSTGSRILWDYDNSAFRAGMTISSQWATRGVGSIGLGLNTVASGHYSASIGRDTIASGGASLAMGWGSTASSQSAVAIGRLLTVTTGDNGAALGGHTNNVSGDNAIALGGELNSVSGANSTVLASTESWAAGIASGVYNSYKGQIASGSMYSTLQASDLSSLEGTVYRNSLIATEGASVTGGSPSGDGASNVAVIASNNSHSTVTTTSSSAVLASSSSRFLGGNITRALIAASLTSDVDLSAGGGTGAVAILASNGSKILSEVSTSAIVASSYSQLGEEMDGAHDSLIAASSNSKIRAGSTTVAIIGAGSSQAALLSGQSVILGGTNHNIAGVNNVILGGRNNSGSTARYGGVVMGAHANVALSGHSINHSGGQWVDPVAGNRGAGSAQRTSFMMHSKHVSPATGEWMTFFPLGNDGVIMTQGVPATAHTILGIRIQVVITELVGGTEVTRFGDFSGQISYGASISSPKTTDLSSNSHNPGITSYGLYQHPNGGWIFELELANSGNQRRGIAYVDALRFTPGINL